MCNELLSHILTHKETDQRDVEYTQRDVEYTQHELILTSLLNEQVLINTDRRYYKKI